MSTPITGMGAMAPLSSPFDQELKLNSGAGEAEGADFGTALKSAFEQVEQLHTDAQQQVGNLLQGDGADIHNVMIAVEKADVAFQMMMQVRNKIVNAYQEISRLQF